MRKVVFMVDDSFLASSLDAYVPIVRFLACFLGRNCEVVLHDLRIPGSSILSIENNHVSGRNVGDSLHNLAAFFQTHVVPASSDVIKPRIVSTRNGKTIRSASYVIRDRSGAAIGLLCLNMDLGDRRRIREMLDGYLVAEPTDSMHEGNREEHEPSSEDSIEDLAHLIIRETISGYGVPASRMTVEEKLSIVDRLRKRGVFLLRGALGEVARLLDTSENSIYRYINKLSDTEERSDPSSTMTERTRV